MSSFYFLFLNVLVKTWICVKICGSSTKSEISSRTTDPNPARQKSDVSKCRPFSISFTQILSSPVTSCSGWTCLEKTWICVKSTKSPRRRLTQNSDGRRRTFLNVVFSLSALLKYRPHPSQPDNKNAAFFWVNVSFCVQHMLCSTKISTRAKTNIQ